MIDNGYKCHSVIINGIYNSKMLKTMEEVNYKQKMKNCMFLILVALIVSCSNHQLTESVSEVMSETLVDEKTKANAEFNALMDKARWGDGQAFLKLADCYKDGIGVKPDLLEMFCMAMQAQDFGALPNVDDYIFSFSEKSDMKTIVEYISKMNGDMKESKDSIMTILNEMDNPDALALYAYACILSGDSIEGNAMIRQAAEKGSNFAVLMDVAPFLQDDVKPNIDKLLQIADRAPVVYNILGKIYSKPDENGFVDNKRAAYYYKKADEHALLSRHGAWWLLDYYNDNGDVQLTDDDVKRLEILARPLFEDEALEVDSLSVDSVVVE